MNEWGSGDQRREGGGKLVAVTDFNCPIVGLGFIPSYMVMLEADK